MKNLIIDSKDIESFLKDQDVYMLDNDHSLNNIYVINEEGLIYKISFRNEEEEKKDKDGNIEILPKGFYFKQVMVRKFIQPVEGVDYSNVCNLVDNLDSLGIAIAYNINKRDKNKPMNRVETYKISDELYAYKQRKEIRRINPKTFTQYNKFLISTNKDVILSPEAHKELIGLGKFIKENEVKDIKVKLDNLIDLNNLPKKYLDVALEVILSENMEFFKEDNSHINTVFLKLSELIDRSRLLKLIKRAELDNWEFNQKRLEENFEKANITEEFAEFLFENLDKDIVQSLHAATLKNQNLLVEIEDNETNLKLFKNVILTEDYNSLTMLYLNVSDTFKEFIETLEAYDAIKEDLQYMM